MLAKINRAGVSVVISNQRIILWDTQNMFYIGMVSVVISNHTESLWDTQNMFHIGCFARRIHAQ